MSTVTVRVTHQQLKMRVSIGKVMSRPHCSLIEVKVIEFREIAIPRALAG